MAPPYSPDISPCDFNCFGQLKNKLRQSPSANWDEFIEKLDDAILDLNTRELMNGVNRLPERWKRVIEAEGEYI